MAASPSLRKELETILQTEDFERLQAFVDPKRWKRLKKDDRHLLARLFVLSGERLLKEDASSATTSFEKAAALAPKSADPLHAWARALFAQGMPQGDLQLLQEAEEKYLEASAISKKETLSLGRILWELGQCQYWIGRISGEAVDFHRAIATLTQAIEEGGADATLCIDLANAYCELASLIGRYELVRKALTHYQSAVEAEPESIDGWLNLGCSGHILYDKFGEEENFQIADQAFDKLIELQPDSPIGYSQKGYLYTLAGKRTLNVELLKEAAGTFEKISGNMQEDPLLIRRWAEAVMLWGAYTEQLNLLRFAENKIEEALELEPDHPDGWYLWGTCRIEMGRYFSDDTYYEQAIEKLQTGLTLDPKATLLWYGLSLATFCLGEAKHDPALIEKSTQYCAKVIELGGDQIPQYWNDWGVSLMKLCELTSEKKYIQEAIHKFETAINLVPEGREPEPQWLYNYGCAYDFLGDFTGDEKAYEKAVEVLRNLINLDPDYGYAAYNLALALSHLGELTSDVEPFQEALDLFYLLSQEDAEDEPLHNDWGLALLNLAQLIDDPHQPEKAQHCREEAEAKFMHALSLGSTHALYSLTCLYSITNHLDLSMAYIQKALKANALPSLDDMMNDEWLDNLRATEIFKAFVDRL